MESIDLKGKHWIIFGLKGSGKSNFAKYLLSSRPRHLVFDPVDEYQGFNQIVPQDRRGEEAQQALGNAIDQAVKPNLEDVDYFHISEVNRYTKKRGNLSGPVGELVDLNRHYELGLGMDTRLPNQVHPSLRELADYIFIFNLAGKSTLEFLDDMAVYARQAVEKLGDYECIMLNENRDIKRIQKVRNMDSYR